MTTGRIDQVAVLPWQNPELRNRIVMQAPVMPNTWTPGNIHTRAFFNLLLHINFLFTRLLQLICSPSNLKTQGKVPLGGGTRYRWIVAEAGRTHHDNLLCQPFVLLLSNANVAEVDFILPVRVKPGRNEDDVGLEINDRRQNFIAP